MTPVPVAPRVALIVDNPLRDLPGLVLVAWELCRRGATCYLVPMNIQVPEVLSLAPDFVLMNYLRTNNENTVRMYLSLGIAVGVLDTEGSIFSALPTTSMRRAAQEGRAVDAVPVLESFAMTMARDAAVREQIACYCAWTPDFAEYFTRTGRYRRDQMIVTGPPRIDFYTPAWRQAARARAISPASASPMVLINGSFPLCNPRFQSPERELEQLITEFSCDREFAEDLLRSQRVALQGFAKLANELASTLPRVDFVYRPHPFEGTAAYAELLDARLPNLRLEKRGTVDAWLIAAKALIHWGSSTSVEASILGIPALTPKWLPLPLPIPIVDDVTLRPASFDALREQVAAAVEDRFCCPASIASAREHAVESAFFRVDGRNHARVASAVLHALARRSVGPSLARGAELQAIARSPHAALDIEAWDASEKRFDADDVGCILDAIARHAEVEATPRARSAGESSSYRLPHPLGRSVRIGEDPRDDAKLSSSTAEHRALGDQAFAQGRLEDAARHYRLGLQRDPRDAELWIACGRLSLRCGDPRSAGLAFERAVSLAPGSSEALDALAHLRTQTS